MPTVAREVILTTPTDMRVGRRMSGFTLVELMITIGIASILLSIAVPSFNQLVVANRLTTQANEVVAALNFARSEAIKRNTSISFCRVESTNSNVCATQAGTWSNWVIVPAGGGNVVRRGVVNTFSGGIGVQSTLNIDQVVFSPEGLARSGGILVSNQRVSICSPRERQGRRVELGRGSRLSTTSFTGTCGP